MSEAHTACTSENLLLRRKTSRKLSLCFLDRRKISNLCRKMPQDKIEKIARITSTTFDIALEFTMISSNADPDVDGKQLSVKSIHAPLGQRAPVWEYRR